MASDSWIAVLTTILTATSLFFVFIRCITRYHIIANAGVDDSLVIGSMICNIVFTALIIFQIQHGLGNKDVYLNASEFSLLMKGFYACLPFYHVGLALVKNSILFQYLRFFPPSRYRQFCWAMIVFTSGYAAVALIWGFYLCQPVAYLWDRSIPGKCAAIRLGFLNAALAIITDILICVLPILVLKDLRLPKFQKYVLIGILMLGGLSVVAATIRVPAVIDLVKSPVIGTDDGAGLVWSSAELNIGIIVACLPTIKPMIVRMVPKSFVGSVTQYLGDVEPDFRQQIVSEEDATPIQSIHRLSRFEIEASETILK